MTDNQERKQNPIRAECNLDRILDFCRELVIHLHMELGLQAKEEDGIVCINFTGPDRPLMLSNGASILNSMEYLVNKVFHTGRSEAPGIVMDSDSYRKHREAELVLLAQMASKKVVMQRKPLSLQPMIPRERRIVHLALAGIEGVRSQSEGEGENRSITIYPAINS